MSFSIPERPRAVRIDVTEDELVVQVADGRVLSVPLEWFPRLRDATPEQRGKFRFIGDGSGIHWPDVDEDLSVAALFARPSPARQPLELGDDEQPLDGGVNETNTWPSS